MHIRCQQPKAAVMNNSKSHNEALKVYRKGSARPAADQEHVPAPSRPARTPSAGRPGLPSRRGCRGAQEGGCRGTKAPTCKAPASGSGAGGRMQGTERLREDTRPPSPRPRAAHRAPCPEGGGPAAAGPVPTGGASGGGGQRGRAAAAAATAAAGGARR